MDNSLNLQTILINVVLGIISTGVSILLPLGISYLRKKVKSINSDIVTKAYDEATIVVDNLVREASQTVVDDIKKNNGKMDKETAIKIKNDVLNKSLSLIKNKTLKVIGKDGSNLKEYISSLIEARVRILKAYDNN